METSVYIVEVLAYLVQAHHLVFNVNIITIKILLIYVNIVELDVQIVLIILTARNVNLIIFWIKMFAIHALQDVKLALIT